MAKLRKRGNVWYSDFTFRGKRIVQALDTDRGEAEIKLRRLLEDCRAQRFGRVVKDAGWQAFKTRYFETVVKSPVTITTERRALRYLEDFARLSRVSDVSPLLLDQFKAHLKKEDRGDIDVNRLVRAVKVVMRTAEGWQQAQPQDWRSVKLLREPKGRLRWLTREEVTRLLTVARGPWRTIVLLGVRAGLRRDEIRNLEWTDVDFEAGRIQIVPKPGWTPKDYERRDIPLLADLRGYLSGLRKGNKRRYVVPEDEAGCRITAGSMTTYMRRLCAEVELSGVCIHTLRHTYGAHMRQDGVPLDVLQKWMGHSKLSTTQIYAHLGPSTSDEWARQVRPLL